MLTVWRTHVYWGQRLSSLRTIATDSAKKFQVGQGGKLLLHIPEVTATVRLKTGWVDASKLAISRLLPPTCSGNKDVTGEMMQTLDVEKLNGTGLALEVDDAEKRVIVKQEEHYVAGSKYLIEAEIPELFSIELTCGSGDVSVTKKLKGDCEIHLGQGNIELGTVRGEAIYLSTGSGSVLVDELEGAIDISATSDLRARLLNGSRVNINAAGEDASVTVGGLYSPGAHIEANGPVAVSSCHGTLSVHTTAPLGNVTLSSVNGAARATTVQGNVHVHMDALEEGTTSKFTSTKGDVALSMSQEVHVDLDIRGAIHKLPDSFEGEVEALAGRAVGAIYSGTSSGPKGGAESYGTGRGKIDLNGARDQSLRQYFPRDRRQQRAKLYAASQKGSVGLETLSWADNITRKFARAPSTGAADER